MLNNENAIYIEADRENRSKPRLKLLELFIRTISALRCRKKILSFNLLDLDGFVSKGNLRQFSRFA